MEHNDYFFYIVVVASVVGSIVKALKKKPDENQVPPQRNVGGDILKKILEEIGEKDDYIPRSPVTAPAVKPAANQPAMNGASKMAASTSVTKRNVEMEYVVPEVKSGMTSTTPSAKNQVFTFVEEPVDPFLASIDLSSVDEMKKAIIYSEILRTKF